MSRRGSSEFFYEGDNGERDDEELHNGILEDGDADAATEVTRERLRARGWSAERINRFLGFA